MTVLAKEENNDSKQLSRYSKIIDDYFKNQECVIHGIPLSLRKDVQLQNFDTVISGAEQYIDYLNKEIGFWKKIDKDNKLEDFTKITALSNAISYFNQATHYNTKASCYNYLRQSCSAMHQGHLNSETELARFLCSNLDKSKGFFTGFYQAMLSTRNTSISSSDALEGFFVALEYSGLMNNIKSQCSEIIANFDKQATLVEKNFAELNGKYLTSFHEQQRRIEDLTHNYNEKVNGLTKEAEEYFANKEKRALELENLYEEKLKIQAPADYWAEMEKQYTKKGRWWLTVSIFVTILILAVLIGALIAFPQMFDKNAHWLEVLKNSAIITVITSIAVYMLRLFVKLSTSSFHLARDAKERNRLTFFYLALIQKKAVTEKERAIILNSLFSRSDTGLIKGDSAPTMAVNVADFLQNISK